MKHLMVIALILLINSSFGMRPINFCKRIHEKCVGTYDEQNVYAEKCHLDKCPKQFKYYCNFFNVCAKNKLSCTQLNETKHYIEKIRIPYTFSHEMIKLKKFISNFRECPLTQSYLKPTDMCLNGNNCFYTISNNESEELPRKAIVCPCPSQYSFHCGDFYCATNSIACNLFISNKNDNTPRRCGNDNVII